MKEEPIEGGGGARCGASSVAPLNVLRQRCAEGTEHDVGHATDVTVFSSRSPETKPVNHCNQSHHHHHTMPARTPRHCGIGAAVAACLLAAPSLAVGPLPHARRNQSPQQPVSVAPSPVMPLTVLDANQSTVDGSVCLDGSPPGFYFRASSAAADQTKWAIFMKGGVSTAAPAAAVVASLPRVAPSL